MSDVTEPADDRMVLIRAMVAIARADGNVDASEEARIRQICSFLRLDAAMEGEVAAMLAPNAPVPQLPDPSELPAYEVRLYVFQQALMMAFADGVIDTQERELTERLAEALQLAPRHIEVAWRRAEEMTER
ncbi:MAG: DUF533 domain-containing protein [Myxococcota bacterium]